MADVGGAVVHFETAWPLINIEITDNVNFQETLPKAQQTQGIAEYFDSFNTLSSKQKLDKSMLQL